MPAPTDPYDFQNLVTIIDANLVNARFRRLFDALNKAVIGLDATSFKDGAFTAAKFAAAGAWQTIALTGVVWSPVNLSFYKDAMGVVRLRPEAFTTVAEIPASATIGTLPAGYRPGVLSYLTLWNVPGSTPEWVSVDVDGTMKYVGGGQGVGGGQIAGTQVFNGNFKAEN